MFNLEGKVEQTGSTLGLSEIWTANIPLSMISYTGRVPDKFISSHSLPVPAIGLIPSPASALAHCPARPGNLRQIQNTHYSLLASYMCHKMCYHPR